jgi:putative membrane protein (TIGR04086 family)
MEDINESELFKNTKRIIKGSVMAIIITLILLFIFSIILTYTSLNENTITPIIIVISAISILIGSSISTLKIKKNGILNGSLVGLIYIVTIYIISSIISAEFSLNINSVIMIASAILSGIIGGIIGVNI